MNIFSFLYVLGNQHTSSPSNLVPPLLGTVDSIDASLITVSNTRQSPPRVVVDRSPLQPAMDKNKECKFKLFFLTLILILEDTWCHTSLLFIF